MPVESGIRTVAEICGDSLVSESFLSLEFIDKLLGITPPLSGHDRNRTAVVATGFSLDEIGRLAEILLISSR